MTIEQLQCFYVVSEYLNFTKAASILFVSQPTLSRQISLLENELGAQLFDRDNRHVALTEAGNILLEVVPDILRQIEATRDKISLLNDSQSKDLRVASLNFYLPKLYQVYYDFEQSYPDVNLEMAFADSMGTSFYRKVLDHTVDIGIGFSFHIENSEEKEALEFLPLYEESFCVLMSDNHKYAHQESISFSEMQEEHVLELQHSKNVPFVKSLWENSGLYNSSNPTHLQADLDSLLLQLKADTKSLAVVPYIVTEMMPSGCVAVSIKDFDTTHQIVMTWRKDNSSPYLANFLSTAKEIFADGPIPMHP